MSVSVYQRGDSPVYYGRLINPLTGKTERFSTGEKSKPAALKVATNRLRELERALERGGERQPIRLKDAFDEYLKSLEARGAPSCRAATNVRNKLLGTAKSSPGKFRFDGNRWLDTLAPLDIARLIQARSAEGLKPQSIAHELTFLRAATRYVGTLRFRLPPTLTGPGADSGWMIPKVSVKTRFLTEAEWLRVYQYLDPDKPVEFERRGSRPGHVSYPPNEELRIARQNARDTFVALTFTGGRSAEIKRLTWERTNPPEFTQLRLWGSKTERERLVPVPEPIRAVFQRRWEDAGRDPDNPLIFPTMRGGVRKGTLRAIGRAIDASGLNSPEVVEQSGRATPHTLRHTFASWLIQNGADLAEVQDAIGHTTLQMTRRYSHLTAARTNEKLGKILTEVAETLGRSF